jgi:phosphopantetheinyl transferase (holo-ACP synthase)
MIGNDIVDLKAARASNWQHPRFLKKVFSPYEQQLISLASNRFRAIWQLWAMKEATYKAYIQKTPGRFFIPQSFESAGLNSRCEVRYGAFCMLVQSIVKPDYLFTQTISNKHIYSGVVTFNSSHYSEQSNVLRSAIFTKIAEINGEAPGALCIRKTAFGIPKLYAADQQLPFELSLSHHGKFGAYSLSAL